MLLISTDDLHKLQNRFDKTNKSKIFYSRIHKLKKLFLTNNYKANKKKAWFFGLNEVIVLV